MISDQGLAIVCPIMAVVITVAVLLQAFAAVPSQAFGANSGENAPSKCQVF